MALDRRDNSRDDKTHLENLVALIPLPYYMGWMLLASAFFSLSLLILLLFERSLEYIYAFLIVSAIIALEGTAINWAHNKLNNFEDVLINIVELPGEVIVESYEKKGAEIFNDRRMMAFAIIFIIFVHLSGIDYHATSFSSSISDVIFRLGYYSAVYIMGAGLYIMMMTALTVNWIGSLPLRVNALFSDFHSVGILYSQFTIYAASAYILWGFFHMIVPPVFSSLKILLWFLGFAVLLVIYFVLPQYSLHKMMTSTKKTKIEIFSTQLRAALDESFGVPTKENVSYLMDMLSVQNQLNQMSEWPFGPHEILNLALIIVIPLIIVLLEIVLGIMR